MRTFEEHMNMKIRLLKGELSIKAITLKEIGDSIILRVDSGKLKSINSLGEVQSLGREVDLLCKELRTYMQALEDYEVFK